MRRVHLFEIAEQAWCPAAVRDALTDYLTFMIERGQPYAPAAPLLAAAIRRTAPGDPCAADGDVVADVVDLAAGAGGPWRALVPALAASGTPVRVRLTDRYPNTAAYARVARETSGVVTGDPRPVPADTVPADAVPADAVPADLVGFRTLFSAFHHFAPPAARAVLGDAASRGAGVAVFEATRRDPRALALTCLTPLFVLLVTPFIRPFRWSRLLLTYVVPAVPLAVLFDGLVSCLRTYTPEELRTLAEASAASGYAWDAGEVGGGPIPVTYLIGVAVAPSALGAQEGAEPAALPAVRPG